MGPTAKTMKACALPVQLYYCPRCQMKYPKGHSHIREPRSPGLSAMIVKQGSCGCWKLKYECEVCKKLICGKNGAHCVRLTKNNIEAANGVKKLCTDCGLKIRRGSI